MSTTVKPATTYVVPESKFFTLASGAKISGGPGGLKALKALHLGYTALIDNDLKMISTFCGSNLLSLDISGSKGITDAGVAYVLNGCPKLEALYIYE
jgi:hypothetical protein